MNLPTTRPFVKICCISSHHEAQQAIAFGASALGLVSAMPSGPGVIDEALIAEIIAAVPPPVATFLLTALQDADAIIAQHRRCPASVLQLVDHVPHAELRRLRQALPGIKLVQVLHVTDAPVLEQAHALPGLVDALLLDSGKSTRRPCNRLMRSTSSRKFQWPLTNSGIYDVLASASSIPRRASP